MASLRKVSEVLLNLYNNGRVKVTNITLGEQDMLEHVSFAYANVMRNFWLAMNKKNSGDEYYFYASLLAPKKFTVSKWDGNARRIVSMTGVPVIRMPENSHIFEVLPVGECGRTEVGLSQVQPGEEKFYLEPEFSDVQFFSLRGDSLHVYNLPECVTDVEVTALYDDPEADVPNDICFDVIGMVMKTVFGVKNIDRTKIDDNSNQLIHQLKQQLGIVAPQ